LATTISSANSRTACFLKRLIRDFSINSKNDLVQRYGYDPQNYDKYGDVALQYLPTSAAFALADLAPLLSKDRTVQVETGFRADPRQAEDQRHHLCRPVERAGRSQEPGLRRLAFLDRGEL